jgi:8-oxo-dGTP pyrophosphatase MutT (NUDIX family)
LPKAAATVVLARDGAHSEIEIYFVQRHGSMGFMGGMHVFPGGKVAPSDGSPQMRKRIARGGDASRHELWGEGVDRDAALDRVVAGVRETFEEAGVLLVDGAQRCDRARMRARLHAGEELSALLEEAELWLRLEHLEPLSRWITPESEPVRFDTSFYVARAPEGQQAEHDAKESIAGLWLTASRALAASSAGEIRLAPPTARTLETLQEAGTVAAAFALARSRPPPIIMPVIRTLGHEVVILYPGDPEHPVRDQALPGPTRRVLRSLP